jgi:hypothetical protein
VRFSLGDHQPESLEDGVGVRRVGFISAAVALLVCATTARADVFRRGLRNEGGSKTKAAAAALTSDNCTGTSQSLNDGTAITWTRATNATCTKDDGTLVVLSSGQPRCSSSGCLVEPAATNIGQFSTDVTNAGGYSLSTAGSGGGGAVTWSSTTDVTDPLGGTSAGKLVTPNMAGGEGATNLALIVNAYTVSGLSGSYTLSIFGRTTSGTRTYYLWGNGGGPVGSATCAASTAWPRCTNTITAPSSFRAGYDLRTATPQQTGQPAGNTYLFGAQLETGTIATSLIPTTNASATRNADVPSFSKPSWLVDGQGCVSVTVNVPTAVSGARAFSFGSGGTIYLQSSTSIRVEDGTNTISATVSDISGRSVVIRAFWAGSTLSLVADGVAASGSYDGTITGSTAYLGTNGGSANWLYGYVSNVKLGSSSTGCQ